MLPQLETELKEEPSLLSKARHNGPKSLPSGPILVGAGDSYAAALCASYLSPSDSLVLDPYELIASPELARSRTVVILSVSGRTKSNVAAARSVKGIAEERIGVTSNEDSPLAKAVDRTIVLPFEYRPRAPGMASFALSLAYCAKLLSVNLGLDFERSYSVGRRVSRGLGFSRAGSTFFLGNRALFAVSMYAAAKLYEFFGAAAHYQRLEEFSHMELFSLKAGDVINIYGGFDPLKIGKTLAASLRTAGYEAYLAPTDRAAGAESVFNAVFATQFAVLRWIEEARIKRPYLLDSKKLAVSDSMIY
jgi:glucosamine--fructose-6-phosphate aminotransferase (isomerizing)